MGSILVGAWFTLVLVCGSAAADVAVRWSSSALFVTAGGSAPVDAVTTAAGHLLIWSPAPPPGDHAVGPAGLVAGREWVLWSSAEPSRRAGDVRGPGQRFDYAGGPLIVADADIGGNRVLAGYVYSRLFEKPLAELKVGDRYYESPSFLGPATMTAYDPMNPATLLFHHSADENDRRSIGFDDPSAVGLHTIVAAAGTENQKRRTIVVDPVSGRLAVGHGDSATVPVMSCQWFRDGEPIAGATTAELGPEYYRAGDTLSCEYRNGDDPGRATAHIFLLGLQAGWNLISLPLSPDNADPAQLLRDATTGRALYTGFVWGWDVVDDCYKPTSVLLPGNGYWVFCPTLPERPTAVAGTIPGVSTVDLVAGWNLVGTVGLKRFCRPANPVTGMIVSPGQIWEWVLAEYANPRNGVMTKGCGYWLQTPGRECISIELDRNDNGVGSQEPEVRP